MHSVSWAVADITKDISPMRLKSVVVGIASGLLRGSVLSRGTAADRMLVQAADASRRPVAQRLVRLPTGVSGAGRGYFEVSGMPTTDQYRVTAWDYTTLESVGNLR